VKKPKKTSKYKKSKRFNDRDLSWTSLNKSDYSDCKFMNTIFGTKNLEGKSFGKIKGYRANFCRSILTNCNFRAAKLEFANLSYCNLTNVDFTGAKLKGTNFYKANLSGAIFRGAVLDKANFKEVLLENTKFESCNIKKAKNLK